MIYARVCRNAVQTKQTKQKTKKDQNMKHLNLELERLEQRIAPGVVCGGHAGSKSGGSNSSGGSKGGHSNGSGGSKSGHSNSSGGSKSGGSKC